jgi:hypothetical protein
MKNKLLSSLLILLNAGITAIYAQNTLNVDLSKTFRPVTHCASGSLYGITETIPSDITAMVAPLKPYMFCQPPRGNNGNQHPYGSSLVVSQRLESVPSAVVQITLPDILPGWPYNWPGKDAWLAQVKSLIQDKIATGRDNYHSYNIWNERGGTWRSTNGDFYTQCWKPTFDLIRAMDPKAKICGPGDAYYNSSGISEFLTYCKNNNCIPDYMSWHQWGSGGIPGAVSNYRQLEKNLGISPIPLCINEYSSKTSDPYEGCPGFSVPFIAKFERHGVESACISWWWTAYPGRLGSLLTPSNQKGGGWYLYKWYGDMSGDMVQVTPPNDNSDGLDGFANIDVNQQSASICLGGNFTGNATVNINGIPSWFGSQVNVKLEYVTWKDKDTPVSGTSFISETTYSVNNGKITVPVNVSSNLYAYRVLLTPKIGLPVATITSPSKDTIVEFPATINIKANVSDVSKISTLKFFVNGTQLGTTKTGAPFIETLNITKAGVYEVTAVIVDKSANQITSQVRTIRTVVAQAAYDYTPHTIPGTIELEEFDLGANGFAYSDATTGSETGVSFRTDTDVDIETCTDLGGGYNIGYATAGEWLEYTVNVLEEGLYDIDLRAACSGTGRTISLSWDDKPLLANVAMPNTTGWQVWQTLKLNQVTLAKGEHILKLTIGATDYVNLNYIKFTKVFEPKPPVIKLDSPAKALNMSSKDTVRFSATASDPDGNIIGVSFYSGATLLATANTVPFVYNWSGMNPGIYYVSARAFDTDGLSTKSDSIKVTVLGVREPFNGTATPIPGRIEAEKYDKGGEGVAYHEANTNGNQGGATYRNDEVDIETTGDSDGEFNIAYILNGEWLSYSVNVSATGKYDMEFRVAKDGTGGLFHVEIDGVNVSGPITVPNSGGWQVWETIKVPNINLTSGAHIMRIAFDSDYMNFNYLEVKPIVTGIDDNQLSQIQLYPNPFTAEGLRIEGVGTFEYKILDVNGNILEKGQVDESKVVGQHLGSGVYFLSIEGQQNNEVFKVIKY